MTPLSSGFLVGSHPKVTKAADCGADLDCLYLEPGPGQLLQGQDQACAPADFWSRFDLEMLDVCRCSMDVSQHVEKNEKEMDRL